MCDYELLDFGCGSRLERFGQYVIERPSLAANGVCKLDDKLWRGINSSFVPNSTDGQRGKWTIKIDSWQIKLDQICLELRCTPFGHVGFFAEHVLNWRELSDTISAVLCERDVVRVLNLFAYTGGATIAAIKPTMLTKTENTLPKYTTTIPKLDETNHKKIEVVHVDSANNIVNWARRNCELNGILDVRFIVDDVRKFVTRELRRGNFYDIVILDPPTYGHGTKGESWKFATDLPKLISDIVGLLSKQPVLIIFTAHTQGFDPDMLSEMLLHAQMPRSMKIKKFQMQLKTKTGKSLPSGYGVTASIYNS
jgi:23S rRNA (cytosine1962-C5)-methyltransferase